MKKIFYTFLTVLFIASFITLPVYAGDVVKLVAGQTETAAHVLIENDDDYVWVNFFDFQSGWCLQEAHIHVATSLSGFPLTGSGNPKIGHFDLAYYASGCTTAPPWLGLPIPDGISEGETILIAIHAVVVGPSGEETGWAVYCGDLANGFPFRGNSWAVYHAYEIEPY
jgi:hypothetical protein